MARLMPSPLARSMRKARVGSSASEVDAGFGQESSITTSREAISNVADDVQASRLAKGIDRKDGPGARGDGSLDETGIEVAGVTFDVHERGDRTQEKPDCACGFVAGAGLQ